ncbi:Rnf-Nqr domain containing protein [Pseudomonas entomophila]|uniref:Rnf-Nqr domain containing protein n=1 Tax=Pseudomonas entomophila TaxID=312306 RepID=UPI002405849C|nr:Rnf-Nqr domain containing protein [Pseudomonas entomophila]MDF9620484.1 Rnf-Nqr domain containing protein [Pseudomonas entomophila]
MSDYVLVLVSATLINLLALQPGQAKRDRLHVLGLCSGLLFLLGLPGGVLLERYVLAPLQWQGLQLYLFVPLMMALAWGLPHLLQRLRPNWPTNGLQPLLMGNVALLGLMLQLTAEGNDPWQALIRGALAGAGFWLALILFNDLRERSRHAEIPVALRGLPIELLGAGVMALAFSGFNGIFAQ